MKRQMLAGILLVVLGGMAVSCSSAMQETASVNEAPAGEAHVQEQEKKDAGAVLADALGSQAQGKAFMASGVENIQGEHCESFSVGTNTAERFVKEAQYAVCPKAGIFVLDVVAAQWKPFTLTQN